MFWELFFLTLLCLVDACSLSTVTGQLEWSHAFYSVAPFGHVAAPTVVSPWLLIFGSTSVAHLQMQPLRFAGLWNSSRRVKCGDCKPEERVWWNIPITHYILICLTQYLLHPLLYPSAGSRQHLPFAFQIHFKLIAFVFSGELTWTPLSFLAVAFCCFTTFVFKEPWNFRARGDPTKSFTPNA